MNRDQIEKRLEKTWSAEWLNVIHRPRDWFEYHACPPEGITTAIITEVEKMLAEAKQRDMGPWACGHWGPGQPGMDCPVCTEIDAKVAEAKAEAIRACADAVFTKVWDKHGAAIAGCVRGTILALLPKPELYWCDHIKPVKGWKEREWVDAITGEDVPDNWGQCPIKGCGAKRPEEKV